MISTLAWLLSIMWLHDGHHLLLIVIYHYECDIAAYGVDEGALGFGEARCYDGSVICCDHVEQVLCEVPLLLQWVSLKLAPDNYHLSSIANIEHAIHMQLAEIHTLENLPLASSFNAFSLSSGMSH